MGLAEMIEVREGKIEQFVEKYNIDTGYKEVLFRREDGQV